MNSGYIGIWGIKSKNLSTIPFPPYFSDLGFHPGYHERQRLWILLCSSKGYWLQRFLYQVLQAAQQAGSRFQILAPLWQGAAAILKKKFQPKFTLSITLSQCLVYSMAARQSYTVHRVPPHFSSTHLAPFLVTTILSALFPMHTLHLNNLPLFHFQQDCSESARMCLVQESARDAGTVCAQNLWLSFSSLLLCKIYFLTSQLPQSS